MTRKILFTVSLLAALIALGGIERGLTINEDRSVISTGEPQYSKPESELSKKAQKQARKQAKKARKQAKAEEEEVSPPPPRFAEARLKTGVRLHYAEWGNPAGQPMILLHGYADSWFSFSRALPYFDPSWRVYILDQRGHGDSDRPASGYALADFAADVIAFMEAKGITQATLVGHSMGSLIAQRVALAAPERVRRLVLLGSATTARNDVILEFQKEVEKLVDPVPAKFVREFQTSAIHQPAPAKFPANFMDRIIAESMKVPARVWKAVMAGMLAGDGKTQLGRIQAPTLIVWGESDAFFSRAEQEALAAAIPNAILKVYPETGHCPNWERPERFAQDLRDFVNRANGIAAPSAGRHHHADAPAKDVMAMTGVGERHHPVSTRNAEAQRFFNQGLALIYAFNHEEAARSFRRAAEFDPQLAMAYWGIALAVGPNYNEATVDSERVKTAYEAIQKAQSLSAAATERERAYIAALAKRFSSDPQPDYKRLALAYRDAMRELHRRYPDDLDAATLFADSMMNVRPWQLWTKDGKPVEGTEEIVAVLEEVLRRDPNHAGANHLYIHAVEASANPERALPSAARLEKLAPKAGHLVHMPSHVYIRTGDYEAAAKSNMEAAAVDRDYIKATGVNGMYPVMYYSHNLHFLVETYNRLGQISKAQAAAKQLEENVRPHVKDMPMIEMFMPAPIYVNLRFGQWSEILLAPEPDRALAATHAIWRYARGVAFAATGKIAEAQKERVALAAEARRITGDAPFGLNSASAVLRIAGPALDARIAWAKGEKIRSIEFWREAVAAWDALNYNEPPDWYYPVRESLGAALLLRDDAAAAEKVFREDLKENPRNPRSLFGLARSLKAQGKHDAATFVEAEFKAAWKNAEVQLKLEEF
jgi:pimeloyl-ACP methyl ester carboxylesterase/Flp pilus assembly protein TadD